MGEFLAPVAIVAIIFVAMPAVFLHYQTELRKTKSISADDERLVDLLHRQLDRARDADLPKP